MDFVDPEARERIENRGISMSNIEYCLEFYEVKYRHRLGFTYCMTLPDGRNIKVAIESDKIANAFCHL